MPRGRAAPTPADMDAYVKRSMVEDPWLRLTQRGGGLGGGGAQYAHALPQRSPLHAGSEGAADAQA